MFCVCKAIFPDKFFVHNIANSVSKLKRKTKKKQQRYIDFVNKFNDIMLYHENSKPKMRKKNNNINTVYGILLCIVRFSHTCRYNE